MTESRFNLVAGAVFAAAVIVLPFFTRSDFILNLATLVMVLSLIHI